MESNTNKNVLIGLSGGVDSAVAAYLLKNDGFTVKAATLKMSDAPAKDSADTASADAAASDDISDAAAVAGQLGIEHFVVDLRERFRESVINYFVESYLSGETPNPCVFCNRNMKFPCMAEFAQSVGCGFVATGHYAVVKKDAASGRYLLLKGADKKKDQSYMLYALNQEMLSKVIFPLGNLTKEKIREIAGDIHLNVASKRDSQDICFIRDGDYSGFIRNFTGMTPKSGNFCDADGKIVGTHKGICSYTVGQRKGLGISSEEPYYVTGKDADKNVVLLGREKDLYCSRVYVSNVNYIAFEKPTGSFRATAKLRYSHHDSPCTVFPEENGMILEFDSPQRAVTPGQSAVLYDGDTVLCGGTIKQG